MFAENRISPCQTSIFKDQPAYEKRILPSRLGIHTICAKQTRKQLPTLLDLLNRNHHHLAQVPLNPRTKPRKDEQVRRARRYIPWLYDSYATVQRDDEEDSGLQAAHELAVRRT